MFINRMNENTMTMAKSGSMPKERLVRWIELVSVNLYANLVLFYCMTITVNLVPFFKIIFLYLFQLAIYKKIYISIRFDFIHI